MKKKSIEHLKLFLIIINFTIVFTSCKPIEALDYKPNVDLQMAPFLINKKVFVKDFIDARPPKDTNSLKLDMRSITNRPNFYGKISNAIEAAIINDFSKNKVFSKIGKDTTDADYILIGEVINFKGKNQLTTYGTVSFVTIVGVYTWLFGMPIIKQETVSDLKISLYTKKGEMLGTYLGKSTKIQRKSRYGANKFIKTLPVKANETFTSSVMQIREQILKDIAKYNK